MCTIQAVLFDLDGTLADTAPDLGAALNALLAEEQRPLQPYEAMRPIASHGARGLVRLGFGDTLDASESERLRQRFLAHYEQCFAHETVLFEQINPLLSALKKRGIVWGIITNKPKRFTDRLISLLPLCCPPAVVVSGDTTSEPKPSLLPMCYALDAIQLPAEACLYVGDAERDIEAGKRAGMKTLIAGWGYMTDLDQPDTWGADGWLKEPMALLSHL